MRRVHSWPEHQRCRLGDVLWYVWRTLSRITWCVKVSWSNGVSLGLARLQKALKFRRNLSVSNPVWASARRPRQCKDTRRTLVCEWKRIANESQKMPSEAVGSHGNVLL